MNKDKNLNKLITKVTMTASSMLMIAAVPFATAGTANAAVAQHPTAVSTGAHAVRVPITTAAQARSAVLHLHTDLTPFTGKYDRLKDFGPAWKDMNGNHCDTRNDILARDLKNIKKDGACKVISGKLYDPYMSNTIINFTYGVKTSSAVQIDHVVPLGYAITVGADKWTFTQREQYANDPEVLLAVDGKSNDQKGDKGPSTWMPKNTAYACTYDIKFVDILNKYNLQIKATDKAVIMKKLATCK